MTDIGSEVPKPAERPAVKLHRARRKYEKDRNTVREEYKAEGENPNDHRRRLRREIRGRLDLRKQYETEDMTGLLTRTAFDEMIGVELEIAKKFGMHSTLIIMDVNKLKEVNDTPGAGHAAGDKLLEKVGEQLRLGTRDEDLVARYGGDEFAVLLTDIDLAESWNWWKRLKVGLDENGISISAGAREIFPREIDEETVEGFTKKADEHMYLVKEWSRSHPGSHFFGSGPDDGRLRSPSQS